MGYAQGITARRYQTRQCSRNKGGSDGMLRFELIWWRLRLPASPYMRDAVPTKPRVYRGGFLSGQPRKATAPEGLHKARLSQVRSLFSGMRFWFPGLAKHAPALGDEMCFARGIEMVLCLLGFLSWAEWFHLLRPVCSNSDVTLIGINSLWPFLSCGSK